MQRSKKRTIGSVTGRHNLEDVRACMFKLDPGIAAHLLFPRAFKLAFKDGSPFTKACPVRITIGYPTEVALINRYPARN